MGYEHTCERKHIFVSLAEADARLVVLRRQQRTGKGRPKIVAYPCPYWQTLGFEHWHIGHKLRRAA